MIESENKITVKNKAIGSNCLPYIIAEMACAHDGCLNKAKKLIDMAVEAEADAIQFEMLDPDDNVVPGTEMYEILKGLQFNSEQWQEIFEYARQYDIAIFNFAYDPASLQLGFELGVDGIKLNSSDLLHTDMLISGAASNLPFSIGTGGSTFDEIGEAVKIIREAGGKNIILMQGVQSFPTLNENARVNRMISLRKAFDCLAGYADHTSGETELAKIIDLLAVGAGASVLEKHITLDRSEKGIDYQSALEPKELKQWVSLMREAYVAMGPKDNGPLIEADYQYRLFQKKTIVAACDINQGEYLSRDKVRYLRNMTTHGLAPTKFPEIDGKQLSSDIKKFDQIQFDNLVG